MFPSHILRVNSEVFSQINLSIPKGAVIGMEGKSGSGKSTIVNLVLGLIEPTDGVIKVDGQNLRGSQITKWQTMIGYVPQEIYLLDDTIRRNIAFGLDDSAINNERILEVLSLVRLDGLVENTSEGLDLLLGERGTRLSGGQKQRIGIARALYHDPEIIVLDEATSALDQKTENEILANLSANDWPKNIFNHSPPKKLVGDVYKMYIIFKMEL